MYICASLQEHTDCDSVTETQPNNHDDENEYDTIQTRPLSGVTANVDINRMSLEEDFDFDQNEFDGFGQSMRA